jgi:hypothetical protein
MTCWYLAVYPVALGLVGLALLFDVAGLARRMAAFFRGRGYWYPILDGNEPATHRLAGFVLAAFGAWIVFVVTRSC